GRLAFAPGGKILATECRRRGPGGTSLTAEVQLWDVVAGKCVATLQGHQQHISALAWSPDRRMLASGGEDGVVLWEGLRNKPLRRLMGHKGFVGWLEFSPDGRLLASQGTHGVILWDVTGARMVLRLRGANPSGVAWAPSGRTLATGSTHPGAVYLWDLSGFAKGPGR